MNNETNFLNELKLYILNYNVKLTKNEYETYIIELFINATIKCITLNEFRNLLDNNIDMLIKKNQYKEVSYTFFCDIKKKLIFNELEQIYDQNHINEIKKFNSIPFSSINIKL
jgi:hypothetical protein